MTGRQRREAAGLLFLAVLARAQDLTIHTTAPLVVVPTSVTDSRGRPIDGLDAEDFQLLDGSAAKHVHVDTIDSGLAPLDLVVLIETTNIALSALAKIKKMGSLVSQAVVGENGEVAVVTFSNELTVTQPFTGDADRVSRAFLALKPSDDMAGPMLDGIELATGLLKARSDASRRAVLLISETRDRGSKARLTDVATLLQRLGVTVYALPYSAYLTPFTIRPEEYEPTGGGLLGVFTELGRLGKQNTVEALTSLTGGTVVTFETKNKLERNLMKIAADLHSRYLLSFVPEQTTQPEFHPITISVRNHPGAKVRFRPGYWTYDDGQQHRVLGK